MIVRAAAFTMLIGSRVRRAALAGLLASATVACAGESAPVYVDELVETPTAPATTAVVVPATTVAPSTVPAVPVEIDRAWSPANAVAELNGRGATAADEVTVDGEPAAVERFDVEADGTFLVQVRIDDEGAHTVCVRDACSRVFTLDPDARSRDEIEESIAEARTIAEEIFDGAAIFPDWSIDVGGPQAGTGGSTDVENKTITVHANRSRTVDDFVVTILHEWGHVVDAERLTDDERAQYRALRGVEPDAPWSDARTHDLDDWGRQPAEDFAEVLVALWTAERDEPHQIRTTSLGPQPDEAVFAAVTELVAS